MVLKQSSCPKAWLPSRAFRGVGRGRGRGEVGWGWGVDVGGVRAEGEGVSLGGGVSSKHSYLPYKCISTSVV